MLLVSQRDVVTHGIQPVRNWYILEAVGNKVNLVAKCVPESFTFGLLNEAFTVLFFFFIWLLWLFSLKRDKTSISVVCSITISTSSSLVRALVSICPPSPYVLLYVFSLLNPSSFFFSGSFSSPPPSFPSTFASIESLSISLFYNWTLAPGCGTAVLGSNPGIFPTWYKLSFLTEDGIVKCGEWPLKDRYLESTMV